jgi:hypothetical protein
MTEEKENTVIRMYAVRVIMNLVVSRRIILKNLPIVLGKAQGHVRVRNVPCHACCVPLFGDLASLRDPASGQT